MSTPKRKLIEVALPLEVINRESAREKSIRHGHPSTFHLWWARRPLAAARAVMFAQFVNDPSSDPGRFPTEREQEAERRRLFSLIERLAVWENGGDRRLLETCMREMQAGHPGGLPTLLDPFAGGGSIPLEAKRLGLEAWANDLNPLPVLINTVLLQLVDRFALAGPTTGGISTSPSASLAADLEAWSEELERRAAARVRANYPARRAGTEPLVYFWARTVTCPNPACRLEIPLVGSWRAAARRGSEVMFVPVVDQSARTVDVRVEVGRTAEPPSTITRNGGRCVACESSFPLSYVKGEGSDGRMGVRLLAVQDRAERGRPFRPADEVDRAAADLQADETPWLDLDLSTHPQYMAPPRYGLTTFRDLFLPRQLLTLLAFVEEMDGLCPQIEQQAEAAGLKSDGIPFYLGGDGAKAYADAMRILLSLGVSRLVNRSSTLCIWHAARGTVEQVFARQAYSMTWLFAEANPFGGASGSFSGQVGYLSRSLAALPAGEGRVTQGPAQDLTIDGPVVVSTDPPYYDSVPYADLSDYFHVWLRRMLQPTLPEVFATTLSPKGEELVADQVRLGGKRAAAEYFETGLTSVFRRLALAHSDEYPMTVFYAYKASESSSDGSTGWETFLAALIEAGWSISGTWPIRTEQAGGLRELGRNALASSVVVVCRKRSNAAEAVGRRGFLNALTEELPEALRMMQQGSVAPVDLAQAAIGPGMAIFTRYAKVVEADGSDMTVRTALALINQVLDEVLAEQEGDFDADSRFCVKWFTQFGWNEAGSGDADVLARATNTSVDGLVRGGIFKAVAGRARLLGIEDLADGWNPLVDDRVSDWEVVVRLAKALDEQGLDAAAVQMSAAGQRRDLDTVKELTYLLFSIAERRGWTRSAILFNGLGTAWNDLEAAARSGAGRPSLAQESLTFDDED